MALPLDLKVHRHEWNGADDSRSFTLIWAFFDQQQDRVPDGWRRLTQFEYNGPMAVYEKRFPYGASVINGRIVV